jgi:hypothetical protein
LLSPDPKEIYKKKIYETGIVSSSVFIFEDKNIRREKFFLNKTATN